MNKIKLKIAEVFQKKDEDRNKKIYGDGYIAEKRMSVSFN